MPQVQQSTVTPHDAVGEMLEARVLIVDAAVGVAYLEEAGTGHTVGVSRDFVGDAAFEMLRSDQQVFFQRNERRIVSTLTFAG